MKGLTTGPRPDITPSQIVAMVLAGVPILAQLLRAFGVYDLGPGEQEALSDAITWCGVLAAALIGGDAVVRTGRNLRAGQVESALAAGGEGDNLEFVQSHTVNTPTRVAPAPPTASSPGTSPGGGVAGPTGFEEPPKQ